MADEENSRYRAYKAKAPPPVPDPGVAPEVPTMTSASTIPPEYEFAGYADGKRKRPAELEEDIVARPLVAPDFVMDIRRFLVNPNLWPRWIFTDRRRYAQALSQGWRPAKASDFKPGFAKLSPYSEEGGTKFINGDLILMLIDRKIYLGALRHKHEVAANFTDTSIAKRISAQKAQAAMGQEVNAYNRWMERQGKRPAMEVFDPNDETENFKGVMSDPKVAAREMNRMGEGHLDTGKLSDLTKEES